MHGKLPFSTDKGYFNGDMFEDWYMSKPEKEHEQLWLFLHKWEEAVIREANEKAMDRIKATFSSIVENDNEKEQSV